MFSFILKLFFIKSAFLSLHADYEEDQVLNNFINAFDDNMTIVNWMKNRNIKRLCNFNLFKGIVDKVRDILTVINNESYTDVKSLILNSNMNLFTLCFSYFETFNIIDSLKRILLINKRHNKYLSKTYKNIKLFEKFLYEEYDRIYFNLELTIVFVGVKCGKETSKNFSKWIRKRYGPKIKFIESLSVEKNLHNALKIMEVSEDILELILPENYEIPVYVVANSKGFKDVKICFDNEIHFFIREKPYKKINYPNNMLKYKTECSRKLSKLNQLDLKNYMNKTFFCNRITTEILVTLFHYYSEIEGVNTTFEIIRKKENQYQIKWSFSKNLSIKAIKEYWLKQEIPDLSKRKIIHKFGLIIDYDIEYSTQKSEYTEDEPIETRLILLSCGHQLGFELIDEFLEYFYIKYDKPLICHICRHTISIVGSYDAVVYKCK